MVDIGYWHYDPRLVDSYYSSSTTLEINARIHAAFIFPVCSLKMIWTCQMQQPMLEAMNTFNQPPYLKTTVSRCSNHPTLILVLFYDIIILLY
ncbi:hypothetical protein C0J52_24744 [Blattella germanica]|nr:hypothetical protein C0J52_24744 [Blattella germanica]